MKVEDDVKASGRPLVAKKVSSSQTPVGKAKEPKLPPVGTRADRQQPSASSSSPAPKYKGLPPSNPAPPHGMPPARPAEDILFIKKKKVSLPFYKHFLRLICRIAKRNKAGGPNGAVPGVRAAINDRLHGRQ